MNIAFTQTREYLKWHESIDEKTFYKEFFENIDGQEQLVAISASFVLELKIGKVLYVPYGPTIIKKTSHIVDKVLEYLQNLAKKENCVFVRLENICPVSRKQNVSLFLPAKKIFAKEGIFQPRMEWWLDLKTSEETLYDNFHKDHRYSIRRAQKENIQVEVITSNFIAYFQSFWKILKETSERDGFHLYPEKYYQALFETTHTKTELDKFLVFTKDRGEYLSVALVVVNDKVANLVFAGSVTVGREKGFNHLMQWESVKKAQQLLCEYYNFGGIYEDGYGKESLRGVTNFKKRFGGFVKFHGDFLDIPVKKFQYFLYLIYKMLK